MKKTAKLFSCMLFVLTVNVAFPQTDEEVAARKVDSLFTSYNAQTPGAAIAIIKEGKIVLTKGYGMADLDHDIPITPQTVFNIASVSKQFTAFAVYLLESEGKLSFDDNIRKYIPELPRYAEDIRIRHLLAHTSGLRDQWALLSLAGWRMDDVITTPQILKLLARQKNTNFRPGTRFNYNNTGYTLLAEIVARISGKDFATFCQEKIFQPLGMTSTQFYDDYEKIVKNKAESYERINNTFHHRSLNVSNTGPSNLLTTVEDLAKWVLNFENPVVGNSRLIQAFNEPSYLDNGNKVVLRIFGKGDTIFHAKGQNLSSYKGARMITHGGHTAAFRTFLGRFPDQHFAIIALSNDEHNETLRARWQIADFYIKEALKDEPQSISAAPQNKMSDPSPVYADNLKNFTGEYYNDEVKTAYTIENRAGKLVMTHIRLADMELKRTGENKFTGSGEQVFSFETEFVKDKNGMATAFLISNFGVTNLRFEKVK
ncbi:MAG: serine hydrolase domain-containing protein [Ferruginibacter sp.]